MGKGNIVGLVGLLSVTGCLVDPGATESQDASDSVAQKMLFMTPGAVYGWAGERRAFGTTEVVYQDDFEVNVESDLIVFSPVARSTDRSGYGYDNRRGGLRWSVLKLDAKQEGLGQRIKTDLGLVVFSRPAGSREAWRPLLCGDVDSDDLPRNGLQFFTPDTVINLAAQTVKTENGQVMFRECGIGTGQRGGSSQIPEFAAYVITRQNWFNMEGEFRYKLEAQCDRADCPRDDTNYEAGGVILDYPGAASYQDPYGNRGYDDRYGNRRNDDQRYDDRYRDPRYDDRNARNGGATRERCDNGYDDDGDSMTDCGDVDCAGQWNGRSYCQDVNRNGGARGSRETCGNNRDDDGDGAFDCNDSECWNDRSCQGGANNACQCYDSRYQEWFTCGCRAAEEEASSEMCECWDDEWQEYYECSCDQA